MVPSVVQGAVAKGGNDMCPRCKSTKVISNYGDNYYNSRINVDRKELFKIYEDIKELSGQIKVVVGSPVEEVMKHKIDVILEKMDSMVEDYTRSEEDNSGMMEAMKGKKEKSIKDTQQRDVYTIPVIGNRYELLMNQEEVYEDEPHDPQHQCLHDEMVIKKKMCRNNGRRVLIFGDSYTKGMSNELQHRLGKSFEVLGIVKPAENMNEIIKTAKVTVSSFTKNDVCIIWGGTQDIAKNEGENGLRQLKDFVSRHNHTRLVLIN
ncbi:hypothetical protein B7P43_G05719 [Cryptotermes secundus]|uniref:SGNH domain-containing protein n=1 Tax=Cryptotermes secundus TaxID=105785 RepID=A0A2J7PND3_9NEOP|nr:hypothetical protein B7P43_G05719 [Cryptotermes secundus]